MQTEKRSNYEKVCEEWRLRFLNMDQQKLMNALPELTAEGDYLTLRHFSRKLGIHRTTGEIAALEDNRPVSITAKLNFYTLLGYVSPLAVFRDQWVPFEKLKGTAPFGPAFQKGIILPFAATFTGHLKELSAAMAQLGGKRLSYSDMGYQVDGFACIPVRFLFWEGDDEFPAQGNLLFDISATDFIHGESIVSIATVGLEEIARAAGLPLASKSYSL